MDGDEGGALGAGRFGVHARGAYRAVWRAEAPSGSDPGSLGIPAGAPGRSEPDALTKGILVRGSHVISNQKLLFCPTRPPEQEPSAVASYTPQRRKSPAHVRL